MKNWVAVYHQKHKFEADFLVIELKNYDIEAILINKLDSNYPFTGFVEILVQSQDELRAKEIINNFIVKDVK